MFLPTDIYPSFKDLPASKIAIEQLQAIGLSYTLAYNQIKTQLKEAEGKYIIERDEARKSAKWSYSMTYVDNEHGRHYHIKRTALNPVAGDTDFYKDIEYSSFKVVNDVFIRTGGGYILFTTGEVLTGEECDMLKRGEVPMRIVETKPNF